MRPDCLFQSCFTEYKQILCFSEILCPFLSCFLKTNQSKNNDISQLRCLQVYSKVQQKKHIGLLKIYGVTNHLSFFYLVLHLSCLNMNSSSCQVCSNYLSCTHSKATLCGCYTARNYFSRIQVSFTWGIGSLNIQRPSVYLNEGKLIQSET